jgi:predicted nucleic acid-binding Zn finger protein
MAMDARQERGMQIANTAKITKRDRGTWIVPSQSQTGRYAVTITKEGKFCTCPDFELRQQPCKHVYAVQYVLFRETTTNGDGTTVEETASARVTYSLNCPVYNAAQASEKETFLNLLRDLCANVAEPTQTVVSLPDFDRHRAALLQGLYGGRAPRSAPQYE